VGNIKSTMAQMNDLHEHWEKNGGDTSDLPSIYTEESVFKTYLDEFAEVTGMPMTLMAKIAYQEKKAGRPMFTKQMYLGIMDWAAHQQGETHVGNMPISLMSGTAGIVSSLYKWSIRRGGQVARKRFNSRGEREAIAMLWAKFGLMMLPTLGTAFGVNWMREMYFENILRKRKNTRKLSEAFAGGADDAMLTIVEQISTSGVLGLWGDLLDTSLNVAATEGNFRGLSLDSRIVLMSSVINFTNAMKFIVASGGDIDYTHVARPMFSALGGSGMLQTIQAINGIGLEIFGPEANTARRGNVANTLSVYGRIMGLESKGFYGTFKPTPINAEMTALEFAVYDNDFGKFKRRWSAALKEAIRSGRAKTIKEAENYVRSSFRQRHPLKKGFRSLTRNDYVRMLRKMDDDSRKTVATAVNRFNAFGEAIGIGSYYGSTR